MLPQSSSRVHAKKTITRLLGKVGKVMPVYEVEIVNIYRVTADSPEQALGSYRVVFEDVPLISVGLAPEQVIDQDEFEFIGGKGEASEA